MKEECEIKECSLREINLVLEEHDRQNLEAIHLIKNQFAQEKGTLKEQLLQCENHI